MSGNGNKESRPWGFGLFGGKRNSKSLFALIIVLGIGIFSHILGAVYLKLKDRKERPVLALKSI